MVALEVAAPGAAGAESQRRKKPWVIGGVALLAAAVAAVPVIVAQAGEAADSCGARKPDGGSRSQVPSS